MGTPSNWLTIIALKARAAPDLAHDSFESGPCFRVEKCVPETTERNQYDPEFYRYIESGAIRSAKCAVPLVLRELSPSTVLDVGCGAGAWLAEYANLGITNFLGVDGDYVRRDQLLIPADRFQGVDVAQDFDLGSRFDLVQCLEVGEHIPHSASATLVSNLTKHGDRILFSAATPGQGGVNHINEQTLDFWRGLFAARGYKPFDLFRPRLKKMHAIESWYRRNMILYVRETAITSVSPAVLAAAIADGVKIADYGSIAFRALSRLLSPLPVSSVSKLARAKHSILLAYRKRGEAK
jgi:SAM-dependent methyltransferase